MIQSAVTGDMAAFNRERLELLPDSALLPEDSLLQSKQSEMIDHMLSRLPGAFQQGIRLIDMEGLDYQDAGKILGLPLGTVKIRLTRARLKMRSLLEHPR